MAFRVGTRLNAWKMNPSRSRRNMVSSLSSRVLRSVSPMKAWPPVRLSSAAMQCMSVGLARTRRAHDGGELAPLEGDVHSVEGSDFGLPRPVDLHRAHRTSGSHGLGGQRGRVAHGKSTPSSLASFSLVEIMGITAGRLHEGRAFCSSQPPGNSSAASSLDRAGTMITSSPCCQFTGVATFLVAVSWSESITRSTSSKLRPVLAG